MIDLNPAHLEFIREILKSQIPNCTVKAFGSRVNGKAKPYSDLDLLVQSKEKLNWKVLANLKEIFQESDLPMRIDVMDERSLQDDFKAALEKKGFVVIQTPPVWA